MKTHQVPNEQKYKSFFIGEFYSNEDDEFGHYVGSSYPNKCAYNWAEMAL